MQRIGATFAVTLILSVALYLISDFWFDLGAEHARTIAGLPLLCSVPIFEMLDQRKLKKNATQARSNLIFTQYKFGIHPIWTILLGGLAFAGWAELITDYMMIYFDFSKFGTIDLDYRSGEAIDNLSIVSFATISPILAGFYFIARWIGTRSKGNIFIPLIGVAIILITIKIASGVVFYISLDSDKRPPDWVFVLANVVGILLFLAIAILGLWRGRQRRPAAYLLYLLGALPDSSRATLLSLAEDEAHMQLSQQIVRPSTRP